MNKREKDRDFHRHGALMRYARALGFGDIHTKIDAKTGLSAIIAIHSTDLGPAIGGCRLHSYRSSGQAMKDVLRLSYMMTLKAAVSGLPHGGAKSVILKPAVIKDRPALFRAFGDFVHEMNGRYISAMDVGTTTQDMEYIAERTPHVIGTSSQGDPSPFTAQGVFRSIQAAVKFKFNRDDLEGLHVALQGAGKVASTLAKQLHQHGAKITVCDIQDSAAQMLAEECSGDVVDCGAIYDVDCDIFAPCALGGTINLDSIQRITASIIAGAANNQLAHKKYGQMLHEKGVLYAPDFVVNAGGLIQAASLHDYQDITKANRLIDRLYDNMLALFERAAKLNQPTTETAELIARERLLAKQDEHAEIA